MNNNKNRALIQKLSLTFVDPRDGSKVIIGVQAKIPEGTGPLRVELIPVLGSFDEEAVGFAPILNQVRDTTLPRIPCPPLVDLTSKEQDEPVDLTNEQDEETSVESETKSETKSDEVPSEDEEETSEEEEASKEEEASEKEEDSDDSEDERAFAEAFADLDAVDEANAVDNNARLPTRRNPRRNPPRRNRRTTRAAASAKFDEDDELDVFPMSQDFF
ncbi:unknown protein [Seminavis robusta]|uniref:Uncharacterized protein n=1 Tax=Seminavis robusta TaxID=568900 RepID=A0A9N8DV01_9STRA|nr:unknown protein [Seminavis robusta]|eukprot:Sro301_g112060.1 n/a (217) ;mRNA; f:64745-65395